VIILRAGVVRIDFYFTETCVSVFLAGGPEGPKHIRRAINGAQLTPIDLSFDAFFIYNIAVKLSYDHNYLEGNR